jgi:hypothetical protein
MTSRVSSPTPAKCYNKAISAVAGKIIFNSSAGPGWYADAQRDIIRNSALSRLMQAAAFLSHHPFPNPVLKESMLAHSVTHRTREIGLRMASARSIINSKW